MGTGKIRLMGLMLAFLIAGNVCAYASEGDTLRATMEKQQQAMRQKLKDYKDSIRNNMKIGAEKHQETLQKVKDCIGMKDALFVQSKNIKVAIKWGMADIEGSGRVASTRFFKETGVCIALTRQKSEFELKEEEMSKKERKKYRKSKEYEENWEAEWAFFYKIQNCIIAENIRFIETRDVEILKMWLAEESQNNYSADKIVPSYFEAGDRTFLISFEATTGIYTATSMPKTEDK